MSTIRNHLYDALKREVVGPNQKEPYLDKITGEEVLLEYVHGAPLKRYGAAILYPQPNRINSSGNGSVDYVDRDQEGVNSDEQIEVLDKTEKGDNDLKTGTGGSADADSLEDDPISFANALKPSSIGFTFRIKAGFSLLQFIFEGGIYSKAEDNFPQYQLNNESKKFEKRDSSQSPYWKRKKINFEADIYTK